MSRRPIRLVCRCCSGDFESLSGRAIYCRKPECQEEKDRARKAAMSKYNSEQYKAVKKSVRQGARDSRLCIKGCGHRTRNYFGVCDYCRERIIQGNDFLAI